MQRMPGRVFVAVALIALVSAACGDSPTVVPRGDATVELAVGQSAVIGGLEIIPSREATRDYLGGD